MSASNRWVKAAAWFLAVSYGIGAPLTAVIEYQSQMLSRRFDYPPWLIYLTCGVQVLCSIGVLVRSTRAPAAFALTMTTIGAVVSHLKIGSPQTAWAAVLYTAVQVWFGLQGRDNAL
jgi:hypothetical protein